MRNFVLYAQEIGTSGTNLAKLVNFQHFDAMCLCSKLIPYVVLFKVWNQKSFVCGKNFTHCTNFMKVMPETLLQYLVHFIFIFIYLGTVAPSVHENCFSGGRGINVFRLQRFDFSRKGGKSWCMFNIKFKVIPKLWSTRRYSPLPIVSFSYRY